MSLKPFTTKKLGHMLLHYLPYGFLAIWVIYFGTAFENTLNLASHGRIDFSVAWSYRFRGTAFETWPTSWSLVFPLWLWLIKFTGARIFWGGLVCLIAALLPRHSVAGKIFFLVLITCGVLFSEAILLWSLTLLLTVKAILFIRSKLPRPAIGHAIAAFMAAAISFAWANPALYAQRQNVLGGKSLLDTIEMRAPGPKISVDENCTAVINPDDLRGVSSLESVSPQSLARFSRIATLDLKIVEENFRLLALKDEKGKPLFSDAARTFAASEARYAHKVLPDLITAKELCLIANFDTPPQSETLPFSRARKIYEMRKKAGLDTKIIQLPAGPSRR